MASLVLQRCHPARVWAPPSDTASRPATKHQATKGTLSHQTRDNGDTARAPKPATSDTQRHSITAVENLADQLWGISLVRVTPRTHQAATGSLRRGPICVSCAPPYPVCCMGHRSERIPAWPAVSPGRPERALFDVAGVTDEARCIPIAHRPPEVLGLNTRQVSLEMQPVSLLVPTGRFGSREVVSRLVLAVSLSGPVGTQSRASRRWRTAQPAKVQRRELADSCPDWPVT